MKICKELRFKNIALILAFVILFSSLLFLSGCSDPKDDLNFRDEKEQIMMSYLHERYNENFELVERKIVERGGSLILGDVLQSWMYGIDVRSEDGKSVSVTTNWKEFKKPSTVKCYDDYLNVKYLSKLEFELKELKEKIFGQVYGSGILDYNDQIIRPSVENLCELPGNTGYDDYALWYAEMSKKDFSNKNRSFRFRAAALSTDWQFVYEEEVERLGTYKDGLQTIGCPMAFSIVYENGYNVCYIGYFIINENWEYSKIEFKSLWDDKNER